MVVRFNHATRAAAVRAELDDWLESKETGAGRSAAED
jgi:hypothetical protein